MNENPALSAAYVNAENTGKVRQGIHLIKTGQGLMRRPLHGELFPLVWKRAG